MANTTSGAYSFDQDFSIACYNCSVEPGYSISASPATQQVCAPETVQYTIEIGQIMGYEEEISLSASAANGINVTFSDDTVMPPATITMEAEVSSSVPHGSYEILIAAIAEDGIEHDTAVGVDVSNAIPDGVSLSYPPNNATEVDLSPTFTWQPSENALSYRLQVSSTPSPEGIFEDVFNIQENVYQLETMLQTNTGYFWRVNASNACGDSEYSSWWSFSTTDAITIMLVDDDDNDPNMLSAYTDALDANGILYNIFDTGNSNNEPTAEDLIGYPLVIWFTGEEWGGFAGPGGAGETALASYIDNGGRLFLSSQDYLYDMGVTSFGQNYLGIGSEDQDTGQTQVDGADVFDGISSGLSYPFFNWSDTISPSSEALLIFDGDAGNAAILKESESGGGAMFLGFPFEAMSDAAQDQVLDVVVDWIGPTTPPCPADCNGDGGVNVTDVLSIIGDWGSTTGCDVNGDGVTNVSDLLEVISNWGACPV